MSAELVTTPFLLALQRQPPPPGLLHHSDRGVQYAADAFATLTAAAGLTRRMSRTAHPHDNALAESFVATLKAEALLEAIPPPSTALRAPAPAPPHRSRSSMTSKPSPTPTAATAPWATALRFQFEQQMFPPNHPPPISST